MKFLIIVAATEHLGIGLDGKLPWKLRREMSHFTRMTTLQTNLKKMNAVVMGRKTWESIPAAFRPLKQRINIVVTQSKQTDFPSGVEVCSSIDDVMSRLHKPPLNSVVDNVWIIGGTSIYEEVMKHNYCHRIYMTWIKTAFQCDTFFPKIPNQFEEVSDRNVSREVQEENGIKYQYKVYENISPSEYSPEIIDIDKTIDKSIKDEKCKEEEEVDVEV